MFREADPAQTYARGKALGVNYIFSGPPERAASPGLQTRLETRGDLFPLLFKNAAISIYAVVKK